MRILLPMTAALAAFAAPAMAQDEAPLDDGAATERAMGEMADKLADPAIQAQASVMAQALLGAMLDLKVGPLAEAMNEAIDGKGPDIDPDARVRDLAPDADAIPGELAERLPQAMQSMSAMTDGMQAMLPALREMAERMKTAMPRADTPQ